MKDINRCYDIRKETDGGVGMNEKFNLKSIITGLVINIVGILMILLDIFWIKSTQNIWISVGCSLLASGIVILAQVFLIEGKKEYPLEKWGVEKIYKTRAEKNADSDPKLDKVKCQVDAVAFGLKSFRTTQNKKVERALKRGVSFRILTMDPCEDNVFLIQREKEENEPVGQIKKSIEDLVKWANNLNSRGYEGKIKIRGYKCMTLDFYWRMDDELYVGPYWYGRGSQQTITYKFGKDKMGFELYADYFESLWNDKENVVGLTEM